MDSFSAPLGLGLDVHHKRMDSRGGYGHVPSEDPEVPPSYEEVTAKEPQMDEATFRAMETAAGQPQMQMPFPQGEQQQIQSIVPETLIVCRYCNATYPLPSGAPSFRCRQCGKLNSMQPEYVLITIDSHM